VLEARADTDAPLMMPASTPLPPSPDQTMVDEFGPDDEGNFCTALWRASASGNLAMVQLLHAAGADADLAEYITGQSPLAVACRFGHVAVAQFLATEPMVSIDAPAHDGATPFMLACRHGQLECIRWLLAQPQEEEEEDAPSCQGSSDAATRWEQCDHDGATPIYAAAKAGHLAVLHCLTEWTMGEHQNATAAAAAAAATPGGSSTDGAAADRSRTDDDDDAHTDTTDDILMRRRQRRLIELARRPTQGGLTPLLAACTKGHTAVLRWVLSMTTAPLDVDDDGSPAGELRCPPPPHQQSLFHLAFHNGCT
jgi:ankyrin repeat protein